MNPVERSDGNRLRCTRCPGENIPGGPSKIEPPRDDEVAAVRLIGVEPCGDAGCGAGRNLPPDLLVMQRVRHFKRVQPANRSLGPKSKKRSVRGRVRFRSVDLQQCRGIPVRKRIRRCHRVISRPVGTQFIPDLLRRGMGRTTLRGLGLGGELGHPSRRIALRRRCRNNGRHSRYRPAVNRDDDVLACRRPLDELAQLRLRFTKIGDHVVIVVAHPRKIQLSFGYQPVNSPSVPVESPWVSTSRPSPCMSVSQRLQSGVCLAGSTMWRPCFTPAPPPARIVGQLSR
jgi:hypothetical protein